METGELRLIGDFKIWDRLIERSPQRSRYLERDFISLFDVPVRYYGMFKKDVCIAGIPVIEADKFNSSALPWCYYQGIAFYDEIYRSSQSRLTQYIIELTEDMTTQLARIEPRFNLSLNPEITDVRGFDWVHYHDPLLQRCKIQPRYTAVLQVDEISAEEIRKLGRSARRQEEKYALSRENLEIRITNNVENLINLYVETFKKQSKSVDDTELTLLKTYSDFILNREYGCIVEILNEDGQTVAASLIFEDHNKTWHVPVVGVGSTRYGGTLLYYAIIDEVKKRGGKAVDFNGANSPQRAYFKHSLGAQSVLFFEISYNAESR